MEVKLSDLDGSVVGIEAFLDNREGRLVVYGCIKTKPEDFVVREISAAGEVVSFSGESERLPTERERDAILEKIEAQQKEKKQRFVFDDPPDWRVALKELITLEEFENVEKVAKGQAQECFLRSPNEFRDRVYLQVCIQNCFPGLDTKMQKAEADDQHEVQQIQVLLDPIYKKFRDGGMTLENCECLLTFLRKGANDPEASKGLELKHGDSKEDRTALHRLIAKTSSSFKTKTETRNGMQRLVVYFMPKTNKKRKRSEPQSYLRFVLQKTNQEHFACFDKLARQLHRPLSAFSYAGTKDKNAVTYQHVVVTGVTPDRILKVNSVESDATGIHVGDLKYVEAPMSLGKASGNRFSIVIRYLSSVTHCTTKMIRSCLDSALVNITRMGFINYFGFQRVGLPTNAVRAHHIGEKIIAGKWKEAVRLLLDIQEGDSDDIAKAKQLYLEAGDVEAALKLMPQGMSVERQLLQGLKRYGDDSFEQAIQGLSFSRRVMYMHAYQSYLFNRMASYRLRQYGPKVVEGDLIHCGDEGSKAVKAVTAVEADELNSSREDALSLVLLPLPGTNVTLPSNATQDAYIKMMEQDGTRNALRESGPVKGAYRSLVTYPRDLEWTWQEEQDNCTYRCFCTLLSFD
ncbi:hypothetical protein DVH05_013617 [Phytophthora capsici]|nr:hypothetical protein DVH05_013617 [Phytophthora capsici]